MPSIRRILVLIAIVCALPAHASLKICAQQWAKLLTFRGEKLVSGKVAIIHYPDKLHTEIEVDGWVFSPNGGFDNPRPVEEVERAARIGGRTFIRIGIRASEEELKRMGVFI